MMSNVSMYLLARIDMMVTTASGRSGKNLMRYAHFANQTKSVDEIKNEFLFAKSRNRR